MVRLVVRPDAPMAPFAAGQYFALGLPVDGRWLMRPYSTASPEATHDGLEFLVRLVPGGSLTPHLWRLRPGDALRIGPPKGIFRLIDGDVARSPADLDRHRAGAVHRHGGVPCAAGSTGRRPSSSTASRGRRSSPIARRSSDGRRTASGTYVPAVSRPADPANAGWRGRTGRLDAVVHDLARTGAIDPGRTVAYLCGNPAMIESVGRALQVEGVPPTAILREHYWSAPAPR